MPFNVTTPEQTQTNEQKKLNVPMPTKPQQPQQGQSNIPQKDVERLRQRIAAKQFALAGLGIDWTPDDDDLRAEYEKLPKDSEDIVAWMPPPKKKEEEEQRLVDFEPFKPDEDEEDYLRLSDTPVEQPKKHPFGLEVYKPTSGSVAPPQEVSGKP